MVPDAVVTVRLDGIVGQLPEARPGVEESGPPCGDRGDRQLLLIFRGGEGLAQGLTASVGSAGMTVSGGPDGLRLTG